MKNISYRYSDKRYIGRKQIKNHTITVYAKTQKECADKLREQIKLFTNTLPNQKDNKKFLFGELFMQWFHQEKEPFIKKDTIDNILLAYRKMEPLHKLNIKRITKQIIYDFLKTFKNDRGKEKVRLYLNACLKYYFTEGIIKINPCANVKVKKTYGKKQAFTYDQQCEILKHLKGTKLEPLILIYLITGMRKNEFNFRSIEKDIDFDNQILKALNLKGRDFVVRYKYIKLSKRAITLIMNNLDIIHKYTAETVYREFAEFLKALNIPGSIVTCRHTFATNCFYLEKPELVISREMGHSTSQITKDIYTDIDYHLSKEKIYKLYNNLYNLN